MSLTNQLTPEMVAITFAVGVGCTLYYAFVHPFVREWYENKRMK